MGGRASGGYLTRQMTRMQADVGRCQALFSRSRSAAGSLRLRLQTFFPDCPNREEQKAQFFPQTDTYRGNNRVFGYTWNRVYARRDSFGQYAFCKCNSLKSVSIANLPLLETVGDYAFSECTRLAKVDFYSLPSLRRPYSIGEYNFRRSKSLKSVSIVHLPLLERIAGSAFLGVWHVPHHCRAVGVAFPPLHP